MLLSINIDVGPQAVWVSFLLLGVFFAHVWGRLRAEWRERSMQMDIKRRAESTIRSKHIAPGARLQVFRIDPRIAIIGHTWDKTKDEGT